MTPRVKSQATHATVRGVELGSGNVFADLNLPDFEERQWRVQLAVRLNDLLAAEDLSEAAAALRMGIAQPHACELKHYKLARFSSERLLRYITLLNRYVEIFNSATSGYRKSAVKCGHGDRVGRGVMARGAVRCPRTSPFSPTQHASQ